VVMVVRELLFDKFYHVLHGLSHIYVRHTKYLDIVLSEILRSLIVVFNISRLEVCIPIDLYDELDLRTVEIYHIRTNPMLSTKLVPKFGSL